MPHCLCVDAGVHAALEPSFGADELLAGVYAYESVGRVGNGTTMPMCARLSRPLPPVGIGRIGRKVR
jgi:hypothetical protein